MAVAAVSSAASVDAPGVGGGGESKLRVWVVVAVNCHQFAVDGAEFDLIREAAVASVAVLWRTFAELGLGAGLEEDDLGAVDGVRLNVGDIKVLLDVRNAHHVAVGGLAHLHGGVAGVQLMQALRAVGPRAAREAELVLLVLAGGVLLAMPEKLCSQQLREPCRPLAREAACGLLHPGHEFHLVANLR